MAKNLAVYHLPLEALPAVQTFLNVIQKVKFPFIVSFAIQQGFFLDHMCLYSAKGPLSEFKFDFFPSVQVFMELEKLLRIHQH